MSKSNIFEVQKKHKTSTNLIVFNFRRRLYASCPVNRLIEIYHEYNENPFSYTEPR